MELAGNKITKHAVGFVAAALIVIGVISFRCPSFVYSYYYYSTESDPLQSRASIDSGECNIFSGEWVPNPDAPYYTNETCRTMHEHQNCMKYGRPDSEFLKWRWKPHGCDLPVFDPATFLEMVAGKSMAFVGDSVARNHMQSMICLLSQVEIPVDLSATPDDRFKRFRFSSYNFTVVSFWSTFLVKSELRADDGPMKIGLYNLYLDEPDPVWATQIDEFDFLIISAGQWYPRPAVYHQGRLVVGCRFCQIPNVTELNPAYTYRHGFRTAFRAIESREGFGGVTFLRTFSPDHYEGGMWNSGGDCQRRRPYQGNETVMGWWVRMFRETQVEELAAAQRRGRKEFRVLDLTEAMFLRPDGHPGRYGHWPNENLTQHNDCVHWCLPGPIDSWADILIHMLKREARGYNGGLKT